MNEIDKQTATNTTPPNKATLPIKPVKFVTQKGAQYRTVHADGVWALAAGSDFALLDFYAEHMPLPSEVIQSVGPTGDFSGEQQVIGVADPKYWIMIRDFQVGVLLSPPAIIQLYRVLGNIIKNSEQLKSLRDSGAIMKGDERYE